MTDYKTMYSKMFNAATNVDRRLLEASILLQQISLELKNAQQECEEIFMATDTAQELPPESGE